MMATSSQTEYLQAVISEQTREFRFLSLVLLALSEPLPEGYTVLSEEFHFLKACF